MLPLIVWFATFSGIGKATVERLALEGASVAIFDINDSAGKKIASESSWLHHTLRLSMVAWLPVVWSSHFLRSQQGRVFRKCPAVFVEAFPLQLDSTIMSIVQRMLDILKGPKTAEKKGWEKSLNCECCWIL